MKRLLFLSLLLFAAVALRAQEAPVVKYECISLDDNGGYYDMNSKVGKIVKGLDDFTFSVIFRVDGKNSLDGNGHFIFACSALAENGENDGPYIACRLNQQRFEISTGGWAHEEFIMAGEKASPDKWTHLLYRQNGHHGELYIDGKLVGSNDKMPYPSEIFKDAPQHNWVGKAPFKGDKYLSDTQIRNLCIYAYPVSDKQVRALSKAKVK